jgi:putative salt-induced outer membrane protein
VRRLSTVTTSRAGIYNSESDKNETANKLLLEARWERVIDDGFFAFVGASYLSDRLSGYDYRLNAGPGLGYETTIAEAHKLKFMLGALASYDRFSKGPVADELYASGNAALEYEWKVTDSLRFREAASYRQSLACGDRFFVTSDTGLLVKINDHFGLGVSYKVEYQNDPPAPDIKRVDTVILTSLAVDY